MQSEPDDWVTLHPGPGQGELVAAPGAERLLPPPGTAQQENTARTAKDFGLAAADTATFGAPGWLPGGQQAIEAARARSPYATTAGDFAGMVPAAAADLAVGGAATPAFFARPLLRTMGREAVVGGGLGAAEAAGHTYSGDPQEIAGNALAGGALGGALGAGGPLAGRAVGKTERAINNLVGKARPDAMVRTFMEGRPQIQAGIAGADPQTMFGDLGPGPLGLTMGATLNPTGANQQALIQSLIDRNRTLSPRKAAETADILGPAPVPSQLHAQVQQQIDALQPHYRRAFAQGQAVDTQPLADWLDTQIVNEVGQARTHLQRIRNDLDVAGSPGTLDPSPEKLGAVRRDLNGLLRTERQSPGTLQDNTVRLLRDARRQMTDEMQAKVPGIQGLDAMRAELGAQQRALQPSRIFETGKQGVMRPEELSDMLAEAARPKGVLPSTQEPLRHQQAARAEIERTIDTKANDLAALRSLMAQPSDWNAQKMSIMFGPDRAARMRAMIERGAAEENTFKKVVEGSQTAQRLAAAQAQTPGIVGEVPGSVHGVLARMGNAAVDAITRGAYANTRNRISGTLLARGPAELQRQADMLWATGRARDAKQRIAEALTQAGFVAGAGVSAKNTAQP